MGRAFIRSDILRKPESRGEVCYPRVIITNAETGKNVHEIADGIYRINTPVELPGAGGAFSFNQYLIRDDEPLLFHTGPRRLFACVREAVDHVIGVEHLRFVGLSHFEADECGSLNEFLAVAPRSVPYCGTIAAMVSVGDYADRPPRALADGESLARRRGRVVARARAPSELGRWLHADEFNLENQCGARWNPRR